MTQKPFCRILLIGSDTPLAYLIRRYAEQGGYELIASVTAPIAAEVMALQPVALLFASVEDLGAAQALIANLNQREATVLVCLSTSDEARARELGADLCLSHPLTYDSFCSALGFAGACSTNG